MVVELKTLKDFPKEVIGIEDKMINETKLRAEAVKWVKDIEKHEFPNLKEDWAMGSKQWIKHFFNLTEEDLK